MGVPPACFRGSCRQGIGIRKEIVIKLKKIDFNTSLIRFLYDLLHRLLSSARTLRFWEKGGCARGGSSYIAFRCIFDKEAWMDLTVGRTAFRSPIHLCVSAWRLGLTS